MPSFRISNVKLSKSDVRSLIKENKPEPKQSEIISLTELENIMNNVEKNLSVIELRQSDFDMGTYRIKTSGYYKLMENISFNPNPSVWDSKTNSLSGNDWNPTSSQTSGGASAIYPIAPYGPYHLGFFAAISVEVDNVVIDLNNFILSQSMKHYLQQRFFSLIELASSPFISGQGPSNFGTPVFYPNFVKIKNGNIGLSSHQGIHGNGMKNIILEDLNLFDYEQAAIGLNGGENMILKNINVGKNSRNVFINATYSQSRFVKTFLEQLISAGNPNITIQGVIKSGTTLLSELVTEMDSVYKDVIIDKKQVTSQLFKNESGIIDGSVYGIILNVLGVAVNKFLTTLNNTSGNKNILIRDVNINSLDSVPVEVVGLSVDGSVSTYGLPAQKGPVGDVFRIVDVTDSNDYYVPDVLSNAQCYISKWKSLITSAGTANIDVDLYDTWVGTVGQKLTPLISSNYFTCGGDSMAHVMKGNIGLFLSGAQDIQMYNISIKNIYNNGELGEVCKCPPNSDVYDGNRCRAIAVVVNKNLKIKGLDIDSVGSKTADSVGIDFIGGTNYVNINGYNIKNIVHGNLLDAGLYPNIDPVSYCIRGAENVSQLVLCKISKQY